MVAHPLLFFFFFFLISFLFFFFFFFFFFKNACTKFHVPKRSQVGHALLSCATMAEACGWAERLAHWQLADRVRGDTGNDRRKGGMRRGDAKRLVVCPAFWAPGLDSADRLPGGSAGRAASLRSRIDRHFFEEYDNLLALAAAGPGEAYAAPRLPGDPSLPPSGDPEDRGRTGTCTPHKKKKLSL